MNRRSFLHASLMAGGLIAMPQFGHWFPERRIRTPAEVLRENTEAIKGLSRSMRYLLVGCDMKGQEIRVEVSAKPHGPFSLIVPRATMDLMARMPRMFLVAQG